MKKYLSILSAAIIFASCGGKPTKVIIMASGDVKAENHIVTLEPGTTHNEVIVSDPGEYVTVKSEGKDQNFTVPGPGVYILNLKKDTISGSFQNVGTAANNEVISQESLTLKIDSLNKLMAGTNVNATSKNYNIKPGEIVKITENANAQIIGPYMRMPGSFEGGKDLEVYKFYTNKELREVADKLTKMVTPETPVEE